MSSQQQQIEELQRIVDNSSLPAGERKAAAERILALGNAEKPTSDLSQVLARLKRETSAEAEQHYLQTHKMCAVCLRHNAKQATACELCKTDSPEWLPVTDPHPTWHGAAFTREYLSNVRSYTSPFDVVHLRWMFNWKHEPKQVNASLFLDQGYVLSDDLRQWCAQLLKWIAPDDEPTPEHQEIVAQPVTKVAQSTSAKPEPPTAPTLDPETYWEYKQWKVIREGEGLTATVAEFMDSLSPSAQCRTGVH